MLLSSRKIPRGIYWGYIGIMERLLDYNRIFIRVIIIVLCNSNGKVLAYGPPAIQVKALGWAWNLDVSY